MLLPWITYLAALLCKTFLICASLCPLALVYYILVHTKKPRVDSSSSSLGVRCGKLHCSAAATKSCARCRVVFYCSRECQVSDYPYHRDKCKLTAAWEERANEDEPPLSLSQAKKLVTAVAQQLDGQLDTPPGEVPPFHRLQHVLSRLSVQNERMLAKAGACEVLASALERAVTGNSPVSLSELFKSLLYLATDSVKNKAAYGALGVISSTAEALRKAIREQDWLLATTAVSFLTELAMAKVSSFCGQFGAAGAFEAVAECVMWAAWSSPDRATLGFNACGALWQLQIMACMCTDARCKNRNRLGQSCGLFAALDTCLGEAVTAAESAAAHQHDLYSHTLDTLTGAPQQCRCGRMYHRDVIADLSSVCTAIYAIAQPEVYPTKLVRLLATPSVCTSLMRALALLTSVLSARDERGASASRCAATRLVLDVVPTIWSLCACHDLGAAFQGPETCSALVRLLLVFNAECGGTASQGDTYAAQCSVLAAIRGLTVDAPSATGLQEAGVFEAVTEALRQAVERRDERLLTHAHDAIRRMVVNVPAIPRQVGRHRTVSVLVSAVQLALDLEAGGKDKPVWPWPFFFWVDFWWPILLAHWTSRKVFLDAGAGDVLRRVLQVHGVANDRKVSTSVRTLREWMLDPTGFAVRRVE
eukprot:jgi/Mesvir1/23566/Mv18263-RA.1